MLRTGLQRSLATLQSRAQRRSFATTTATRTKVNEAVIVSALRTPIGSFSKSLKGVTAAKLGSTVIKAALDKAAKGVKPEAVDEVLMGNVIQANQGQAPARQAALGAGLPNKVPCTTVNKVCSSGMKTVMFAAQAVMLGHGNVIVAGGMESMSNAPYYATRNSLGYGHQKLEDSIVKDGLWEVYNDFHMGNCGEDCARKHNISREQQDAYAVESYKRAAAAWESGAFDNEVVPIEIPQRRGDPVVVKKDEDYTAVKFEKIPKLRPAFDKAGTVTAANASNINDGASALVVMDHETAKAQGIKPMAKIIGFGDAAREPIEFTTAPVDAIHVALKRAGITKEQVDFWEINEAFSVVALANMKLLGLDHAKLNINGGGVSLGHPIGCSGARITTSLLHILEAKNAKYGCAAICNGGGGASAIVVERL